MNANQLTKAIINVINLKGGHARRINVIGVPLRNGGFRKSPNKGISDIIACIEGKFIAIEIKIGNDKQSIEQVKFQMDVELAGGVYILIHTFDEFVQWHKNLI